MSVLWAAGPMGEAAGVGVGNGATMGEINFFASFLSSPVVILLCRVLSDTYYGSTVEFSIPSDPR